MLGDYEGRYELVEAAIGPAARRARFTFDESGRYGRLSDELDLGRTIEVPVLRLSDELERIQRHEGRPVDLLKLDTEGSEPELLASLPDGSPRVLSGRQRPGEANASRARRLVRVHVMPSWFETTGLASLEANLSGATVFSTNQGYVRDYFGRDVEYADRASLTSIRTVACGACAAGRSEALRHRIVGNVTIQQAARETVAAYHYALRGRAR